MVTSGLRALIKSVALVAQCCKYSVMLRFMATTNPRVSVTVTPAVSSVLREMALLTGNSQSALIGDLLQESLPIFTRMVEVLRAAKDAQAGAKERFRGGLEDAQGLLERQLGLMLGDVSGHTKNLSLELERLARRGGRAVPSTPEAAAEPPVPPALTGGSGDPASRPRKAKTGVRKGRS